MSPVPQQESILVTGATGCTGGRLAARLAANGCILRALVRDPARASELKEQGAELVVGDLRDPASLARAMEGVALVYHIAASFRSESASDEEMWESNATGTASLLAAAEAAGVRRVVHCSTVGVHGDIENPPADETAPFAPGDRYQNSKLEGERIAQQYQRDSSLEVVVFRPAGIYGPGDLRFLKLVKSIARKRFVMLGSGDVHYQMIYVEDLVDGILLCGTRPEAAGQIYILTGSQSMTLAQLIENVAEVLGVPRPRWRFPVGPVYAAGALCELVCRPLGIEPPLYRRRVDFFRKNRSFDVSKAKRELGFEAQTSLDQGLRQTIDWYRSKGLL